MTQAQLEREVAHQTGENVSFIRSLGFSEMIMPIILEPPNGFKQENRHPYGLRSKIQLASSSLRETA